MSVKLKGKNGEDCDTSNGEWLAITAMAEAFGVIDHKWNCCHDDPVDYSPEVLRDMAYQAEQIGKAAVYLRALADDGGLVGLS